MARYERYGLLYYPVRGVAEAQPPYVKDNVEKTLLTLQNIVNILNNKYQDKYEVEYCGDFNFIRKNGERIECFGQILHELNKF